MRPAIVLDLDETLVSVDCCSRGPDCMHRTFMHSWSVFDVHLRPYCHDFLDWCEERFDIIIFSAADQEYVQKVTDIIFESRAVKPVAVMDARHLCHDYTKSFKEVEKITGYLDLVAVDDKKRNYKFEESRVIYIKEWKTGQHEDVELLFLLSNTLFCRQ